MSGSPPLDSFGRRRSPAAGPGYAADQAGSGDPCCEFGVPSGSREVAMDDWDFEQLEPWLHTRPSGCARAYH
jgi:hypothetical protein